MKSKGLGPKYMFFWGWALCTLLRRYRKEWLLLGGPEFLFSVQAAVLPVCTYKISLYQTKEVGGCFNDLHRYYSLRCLATPNFLLIDKVLYQFSKQITNKTKSEHWQLTKNLTVVTIRSLQKRVWDYFQ